MSQTNKTENKKPKTLYIIVGVMILFGLLSKMCGSDKEKKIAPTENVKIEKVEQPIAKQEVNSVQFDFMNKKTEKFKELIETGASADAIKSQSNSSTKDFLREQGNELKNWEGVISIVDMPNEVNLPIAITLQSRKIVGRKIISKNGRDFTFDCGVTIEATQGDSKRYGYKGISRQGELYDKVKQLKEGDKVVFTAKVVNATDNTELTGLNLSTLFAISLTDIKKQ